MMSFEEPLFVSPYGDDAVVVNHSLVKSGSLAYQFLGLDQELKCRLRYEGHYWLEQCFSKGPPILAVDLKIVFKLLIQIFFYVLMKIGARRFVLLI
ncbi:hypothetical protein TNCT_529451 [Trichonephila clavata]|uniref:Uncharacterized protein n=1 Tax=Trichonephila clavata TaxID=2740835 RepID=A0A8X6FF17_TRICU|nr:hypothetical protein TNCT_529451 [Trichonephila clavata]